jgi:hypothetical protein
LTAPRQLWTLWRNALRLDLRPRVAAHGGLGQVAPLVLNLGFHLLTGLLIARTVHAAGMPIAAAAAVCYVVAGALVFMHLIVESDLLVAPLDGDVLYWRPISARTLFLARALHVLTYVGILSFAQAVVPAVVLAAGAPRAAWVFVSVIAAGWLNAIWVTAVALLLHAAVLRRLTTEKLHDLLTAFQLVFMIAFVAAYQLVTPELLRPVSDWMGGGWRSWLLPAVWFGALPGLVRDGWDSGLAGRAAAGAVALGVAVAFAIGRLAPRYESTLAALGGAAGGPARASRLARGLDALGAYVGGPPLRRAGFDFLLAQLRGDRRTRAALWLSMGLPLGALIAAVVGSRGVNPYGPEARGLPAAWQGDQLPLALFMSAYLACLSLLGVAQGLARSTHWRGAWVFHAAPIRRYEEFCLGLGVAVAASTLVPVFAIQAALLLAVWRQPLAVLMHLAPPFGLAVVSLAASPLFGFEPPFSREPMRHERAADIVLVFASMLPIAAVALGHWAIRDHTWVPIAGGAALAALAPAAWMLSRRRIRNCFRNHVFAG